MAIHTAVLLLLAIPWFTLCVTRVSAQSPSWDTHAAAGRRYFEEGRYAEAEKQYLEAVRKAEEFGPKDSRLSVSLSNLAVVYRAQGRFAEGERLYKRSLEIDQSAPGAENLQVATTLNNLAVLYRDMGRYAEAVSLQRQALAIDEKALGQNHFTVARDLGNLAGALDKQGKYAEA